MKFDLPKDQSSIIKVIGVGGGGSNAVNHMYNQGIRGVDFMVCNTDRQALDTSPVPLKVQLGTTLTEGNGAGSNPSVGKDSAIENIDDVKEILSKNTKMVFITAGMGGGTGTGAAPIIAQAAKELGILTVGIVTVPFSFEGRRRQEQAELGLKTMRDTVDTLLVICNDRLREMYGNLKLHEAFAKADDVLTVAAKGIAEIITVTGYINVDFMDVRTVMQDGGTAIMGSAVAEGENRAVKAVSQALASPLLDDNDILGANYILLNITSGTDEIEMDEISEITDYIQNEAGNTADVIWGNGVDQSLGEQIQVTVIATGFGKKDKSVVDASGKEENRKVVRSLDEDVETEMTMQLEDSPSEPQQPEEPEIKAEDPELDVNEPQQVSFEFDVRKYTREPQDQTTSASETNTEEHTDSIENTDGIVRKYDLYEDELPTNQQAEEIDNEPSQEITASSEEITVSESEVVEESNESEEDELSQKEQMKRSQERMMRLKSISFKMKSPSGIKDLEDEPAYMRRNIDLDDVPHSSESNVSRYTLTDDEENENKAKLKDNNSYLHDNVD